MNYKFRNTMELEQEFAKEERMARLIPSNGTQTGCAGKRYYEVIRTRDLNSCDIRPVYQKVSGADVNIDVGKANAGNLMAVSKQKYDSIKWIYKL